jgi:hypothetical protein
MLSSGQCHGWMSELKRAMIVEEEIVNYIEVYQ